LSVGLQDKHHGEHQEYGDAEIGHGAM
jgi:hypothetical protein